MADGDGGRDGAWNAAELLQAATAGAGERAVVFAALRALLGGLLARPLRARDGLLYWVALEEHDDVLQAVLLKLLERSPLPVVGQSDSACRAYLGAMLVHQWLSEKRRSRRWVEGARAEAAVGTAEAPSPLAELESARLVLRRLFEGAREARAPRYRDELDRTWRQIGALCFEGESMNEVLRRDEGVDDETPPRERKRAVDRVLKAHQRVREELLAAADSLARSGALSWVEAERAREACRLLFRCQRAPRSRVPEKDR